VHIKEDNPDTNYFKGDNKKRYLVLWNGGVGYPFLIRFTVTIFMNVNPFESIICKVGWIK